MTSVTQPCTAAVEDTFESGRPMREENWLPCGEPVAELGPCQQVMGGKGETHWYCGHSEPQHDALDEDHDYQGTLTHVTLDDPCVECGGFELDEQHLEENEEEFDHAYVPTVTERTDLEHEPEVAG